MQRAPTPPVIWRFGVWPNEKGRMRSTARLQLAILLVTVGLCMTAYFMVAMLVPLYGLALGLTPAAIGMLVSLTFLAPLFLAVPLGGALDRRAARPFFVTGATAMCGLPIFTALLPSGATIAAMQVGMGLALITIMLSGQAILATHGPAETRLQYLGWYTTAVAAGQLIGPGVAGFLAEAVGYSSSLALAGAFAGVAAVGAMLVRPSGRGAVQGHLHVNRLLQMTRLWRRNGVRLAMIASSAVLLATAVNQVLLPITMITAGVPASTIGMLFSLMACAAMIVRPFVSRVTAALGAQDVAILGAAFLTSGGLLVLGLHREMSHVVLGVLMLGIGSGLSQPLSMAMVLDAVDKREQGVALGFRISGNRLAQILGPASMGVVATYLGAPAALVVASILVSSVLAAVTLTHRLAEGRRSSEQP